MFLRQSHHHHHHHNHHYQLKIAGRSKLCLPNRQRCENYDHVTPLLKSLSWLPVKDQQYYRQGIMAFKYMTSHAPRISYVPIYYP